MNPLVTIFTPTYNRAYCLTNLYESLLNQDCTDFEWLIVDDGSNDNTDELVKIWQSENKINIRYSYQVNKGKSSAINNGVNKAFGELFFIVDSDDYLTNDAISSIKNEWSHLTNISVAGICFRKISAMSHKLLGGECDSSNRIISNHIKLNLNFDKAEVFVTRKLHEFPFPEFEGEKFVPESYIWCQLTEKYGMYYILDKGIYICEYLPDGYTHNFKKNLLNNPKGFLCYYLYTFKNNGFGYKSRLKALIRILQIKIYQLFY